jgi:hypothetical protein
VCAGSEAELFRTPAVRVHGDAAPVSNPPLTIRFDEVADELIVRLMDVVWVSVPEVPVTVIVLVPTVAVLLAVKVNTLVEVVGFVPNAAVTPEGRAELESVTLPVKPPEGVTEIVLLPAVPCLTVKLDGDADNEKSGVATAFTVNETEVVWVNAPDVPVIVTDEVPVVAVLLADSVSKLLPVVGLVPKVAVTPAGRPDADKLTLPVKPPDGLTVIVELPLLPRVTDKLLGEADSVKFGEGAPAGKVTQLFAELENSN